MTFWRHPDFAKRLLFGALFFAVVLPFVVWQVYSGPFVWPGLVANYTASLAAFLCALA